jgi:hypothetical protein
VFLDPDKGLGRGGRSHATLDEVKLFRRPGERALVLIKFPEHTQYDVQEKAYLDGIRRETLASRFLNLRTSVAVPAARGRVVPRRRWFTLIDHDNDLAMRLANSADKLNSIPKARAIIRPEITETAAL